MKTTGQWRAAALVALVGLGAIPALAQTWMEQGPGPTTGGQTAGMEAQGSPVYGAVERIAVNPTDPNIMLIGAVNGGVWRTTNATAANPNWTPVTDFLPSLSIGGLTYDKANPNIVYAGMGKYSALSSQGGARAGLFKSTDGGLTWAAVAGNSSLATPGVNISGVVANGSTVLVSTDAADNNSYSYIGLWRSTDGGASFTKLDSEAGLAGRRATAIVADPTNANRYYLAVHDAATTSDAGVYRSDNGGATWTQLHDTALDALMTTTTSNMKLSINNNGVLFVAVANDGRCSGVFRTTDQGASFTDFSIPTTIDGPATNTVVNGIHPGGQAGIHFSLLADPTNNDVVYIGGDRQPIYKEVNGVSAVGATNYSGRLFRSSGAGSWTAITDNQAAGGSGPHADSRVMAFDLSGNIVEGDDGGLYRLSSPGTTNRNWTAIGSSGATGLRVTEVHSIAYDSHGGVLIAGTQDNGTPMQTVHNGTTWTSVSQGDGGVVGVYDRPGGNSYRYSSYYELKGFRRQTFDSSGTKVGTDDYLDLTVNGSGGMTINTFEPSAFPGDEGSKAYVPDGTTTPPGVPFYPKFAVNKVDAGRLVFGTRSLYETADHGDTLEVLGGITSTNTPAIRFSAVVDALAYGGFKGTNAYADVLYSGAGTELRIRPAGAGFNVLPGIDAAYTTAAGSTNFSITDIVLDYTDWDHAFVANSAGRVFYSLDGGVTWTEIPGLSTVIGGELATLEYIENGSIEAVFAGGLNGVFWAVETNGTFGAWSEFGASSLPNAKITDLDYNRYADVLSVGTLGRGAWTIENASLFLVPEPGSAALLLLGLGGLVLRQRRRECA